MLLPWNEFTTILLGGDGLSVWVLGQDKLVGATLAWLGGLRLERFGPLPWAAPEFFTNASSLARFKSIWLVSGAEAETHNMEHAGGKGDTENRDQERIRRYTDRSGYFEKSLIK